MTTYKKITTRTGMLDTNRQQPAPAGETATMNSGWTNLTDFSGSEAKFSGKLGANLIGPPPAAETSGVVSAASGSDSSVTEEEEEEPSKFTGGNVEIKHSYQKDDHLFGVPFPEKDDAE
ncbi:hypothetical protein BDR26DRAFT_1004753 [Obelidium mucronatum]|nr:hypothetical protein BDR26DRAFT_1004753 [Obelidium mucronatum]